MVFFFEKMIEMFICSLKVTEEWLYWKLVLMII
ncbi:hypothetical protein IGK28_000753 [Enterococcus sp. DIV0182]|nr:hypothetical protein A5800_000914 [Enterococcus sp. 5B7_DIV0075]